MIVYIRSVQKDYQQDDDTMLQAAIKASMEQM